MPVEVGKPVEGGKPVKELHLNAYAKVNLTLNVGGARSDGYHEIESVMHTLALHDSITLREAGTGVEVLVTNSEVPNDQRNLVVRGWPGGGGSGWRFFHRCRRDGSSWPGHRWPSRRSGPTGSSIRRPLRCGRTPRRWWTP